MSPASDFLVSRFEMRVSALDGSGGVTGTLVAARDSRSTGDAGRERVLKEFRGEESWGEMRDQYRVLMMSRPSSPQPQGAKATAGLGSSL